MGHHHEPSSSIQLPILLLIITLSLMSGKQVVACRHLLETTLPPKVELPSIPTLPKLEQPPLPKADELPQLPDHLPTLKEPQLPTFPKPELPALEKPQLPHLPELEVPKIPELPALPHLPDLPKLTIPTIPTLIPKEIQFPFPSLSPPLSTTTP